MTDDAGEPVTGDDAHLAALLAVLTLARADRAPDGTPLQQWRRRRLAALSPGESRRLVPPTDRSP